MAGRTTATGDAVEALAELPRPNGTGDVTRPHEDRPPIFVPDIGVNFSTAAESDMAASLYIDVGVDAQGRPFRIYLSYAQAEHVMRILPAPTEVLRRIRLDYGFDD